MARQNRKERSISCAYKVDAWQLSAQDLSKAFFGELISHDKESSMVSKHL